MNVTAIKAMEEFAQQVLRLSPEGQNEFFKNLAEIGITEEEIESLQKYVALYHMFTDPRQYKKMRAATLELLKIEWGITE